MENTTAQIIDSVELLRPLPANVKAQLTAQLSERILKPGEVLFQQGDPGDGLFLIADGLLSVFITDPALEIQVDLATLGRNEVVGEMALVTGEARSATVKASTAAKVLCLRREVFQRLVEHVPQVGLSIAGSLAKRLDQVNRTRGIPFASLVGKSPTKELKDLVPVSVVKRQKMAPVSMNGNVVTVATPNPKNKIGVDEFRQLLRGKDVRLVAVSESDYDVFVAKHFASGQARKPQAVMQDFGSLAKTIKFVGGPTATDAASSIKQAQSQDAVNLLNQILAEGIGQGASDIHLEATSEAFRIRYRIDGRLQDRKPALAKNAHAPILSRLKIVAGLDIAEKRLPQDGRVSLTLGGKNYDLRVATIDARFGEKATLRVLDSANLSNDLATLIPAEKIAGIIRKLFYRPNGLVLVTGPTGSGKSTTLYAGITERINPELNICTIEDPIEYHIDGVTQVGVNEAIGLGFSEIMRSFLRQDPDIILVGETRDSETAKLSVNAALTGHLVLSSFHTNDAAGAIQRLRALDVEDFMVAEALVGIINQRLVRRICSHCRIETPLSPMIRDNLNHAGVSLTVDTKFFHGKGCAQCGHSGFKGRCGVYELLVAGPNVSEAIASGADGIRIREAGTADGSYVPLARYARYLLSEGVTTPSEILRILPRG